MKPKMSAIVAASSAVGVFALWQLAVIHTYDAGPTDLRLLAPPAATEPLPLFGPWQLTQSFDRFADPSSPSSLERARGES